MCLLKCEQKDTNCGHEECKKYYMLNKQLCIHNPSNSNGPNNMLNNITMLLHNQNQQRSMMQSPMRFNMDMQQTLNVKRPENFTNHNDSEEAETLVLNNKKLKTVNENRGNEYQQPQKNNNDVAGNVCATAVLPQQFNNVFDNRALLNNQILNNYLFSNSQSSKPEVQMPQMSDVLASLIQATQGNPMGANFNSQQGAVGISKANQMNNPFENTAVENKTKIEPETNTDAFLKEFQMRFMNLISNQNKMLIDLKEKNDSIQDTLACLINEVSTLKKVIAQPIQERAIVSLNASNPIAVHQTLTNSTESVSVETLMNYLYGPNPDFEYSIVLKHEFPLPLYRERNFKFTVLLVNKNGEIVENSNRIPLTISVYSCENPPKYIDSNTAGNKILKGFIEKDLINGSASFDKIQIKEVTSHFRNGWIFIVVHPKITKNITNNVLLTGNKVLVEAQKIRPLVLEKVIVKAKKTKERDQSNNNEYTPGNESSKEDTLYE